MGLLSPLWELRHGLWKVGALRSEALRFPSQAWVDPSCPSPGSGLHHHPLTHCGPGPPVPSSTCGFEVPNFSLALRTTLELLLGGGGLIQPQGISSSPPGSELHGPGTRSCLRVHLCGAAGEFPPRHLPPCPRPDQCPEGEGIIPSPSRLSQSEHFVPQTVLSKDFMFAFKGTNELGIVSGKCSQIDTQHLTALTAWALATSWCLCGSLCRVQHFCI